MSYQDDLNAAQAIREPTITDFPLNRAITVSFLVPGDETYLTRISFPNDRRGYYGVDDSVVDISSIQSEIVGNLELLISLGAIDSRQVLPTPGPQDNSPDITFGMFDFSNSAREKGVKAATWHDINTAQAREQPIIVFDSLLQNENDARALNHYILHELGHAIGLNHTADDAGNALQSLNNDDYDSLKYSIMSYKAHPSFKAPPNSPSDFFPTSLMLLDYLALKEFLGAYATGADSYFWNKNEKVLHTIYDTGGDDTISAAGHDTRAIIDLRQGQFSSYGQGSPTQNLAIAYGTEIENAIGGDEDDVLIGNVHDNQLQGGDGSDVLYGDGSSYDVSDWDYSFFNSGRKNAYRDEVGAGYHERKGLPNDSGNDRIRDSGSMYRAVKLLTC